MLILPEDKRHFFKAPFGILYPGVDAILPLLSGRTVYSVGDVVTYYLIQRGFFPSIAVIDGHTMRSPCNRSPAIFRRRLHVVNPPGSLSDALMEALADALNNPPVLIVVDGEEDLAVIPLVVSAPPGAIILYGQPGEGVVLREVDEEARSKAIVMLSYFERTANS